MYIIAKGVIPWAPTSPLRLYSWPAACEKSKCVIHVESATRHVYCSVQQCQAIVDTLLELPINVHIVVHCSQGGTNPSWRNAINWTWINTNSRRSHSSLVNVLHRGIYQIFANLKAIFLGKYLSRRAFTASRSPVWRKAERKHKFIEIKDPKYNTIQSNKVIKVVAMLPHNCLSHLSQCRRT